MRRWDVACKHPGTLQLKVLITGEGRVKYQPRAYKILEFLMSYELSGKVMLAVLSC